MMCLKNFPDLTLTINLIMKSIIVAGILLSAAAPAVAGPYANIETNSGRVGNDYTGSVIETHVGYEGALGEDTGYYVQAGPAIVLADGVDAETEMSGKAGLTHEWTDSLSSYSEVSFITGDDTSWNVKTGLTYRF